MGSLGSSLQLLYWMYSVRTSSGFCKIVLAFVRPPLRRFVRSRRASDLRQCIVVERVHRNCLRAVTLLYGQLDAFGVGEYAVMGSKIS